ncbi:MAG: hypothetical protein K2L95_04105 [Alphaproteobacteria bacterium]|nr:hypothetical protein [Alphaproteobacteria bacterium]
MITKKFGLIFSAICVMAAMGPDAHAAAARNSGQSAIQKGTNVRAKVTATGLYDQACYDAYYGCMDQFCIPDNANGGSCACSDDSIALEKQFEDIQATLAEAERIRTIEVEKIQAGAQADIIFNGERQYDAQGNVLKVDAVTEAQAKEKKRADLMSLFQNTQYDDDEPDTLETLANKTGSALFAVAEDICMAQIPDSCDKDIQFLRQLYSRQITSDCKGFENSIATKKAAADLELLNAQGEVRAALKQSFDDANKYDRGTCMVEFKKCMQTDDACGKNWENCVSVIASENMQNNKAISTANTTVANVTKYDITASTMEILDSKRNICEKVLNQCMAVRDMVWPDFLREAAPTIKVAELAAESKMRQSCLTDISKCIQTACKDDIVGKGVDTMDACLSRPDMARSFCKVQIDTCERMEPLIWGYVVDKLAAMRVDACTQEVKDCFTDESRCGPDFSNCIGMDYDYIHDMCPLDKLVVCKANNSNFSMDDLDSMLMGLYLNIDNSALDHCQELVDRKMAEVCGSTTDCNRFAADDTIGTGSLRSQKDGNIYRVTGMISFGSIKMGDATGKTVDAGDDGKTKLGPGEIGVQEYLATARNRNSSVANAAGIMSSIEEELNNIAGTINRTIELIAQDPEIQYCVNGRDLSQITGKKAQTTGRFPNLLNQVKMQIAIAALRQAQNNYNAKLNAEIARATQDASADVAQYMCHKIAESGGQMYGAVDADTPLAEPYAISYDVGSGLTTADLTKGGTGQYKTEAGNGNGSNMTKDVTSVFNRETRTCHVCTTITTSSCTVKGGNWFRKKNTDCTVETQGPNCEDIQM